MCLPNRGRMRVFARVLALFLAACLLPSSLFSREATGVWQPPLPPPAGCPTLSFDVVLLDISLSMKRRGRFEDAKQRVTQFLTQAPACSLVVVGTFGLTADVRDGQFLTIEGRARLLAVVNSLHPTHSYTNEDEAAKLIELISYQLRDAYGAQANQLVARVYSDFENSPSADKPHMSVGRFLAGRMGADYSQLTLKEAPKGPAAEPDAASPDPGRATNAPPGPAIPRGSRSSLPAMCVGAGGVLGLLVLLAVVLARGRQSRPGESKLEALLVTESVAAENPDTPPTVHPGRRVEVATGVPAVFSTDPNSATFIAASVPGAPAGELFRIVPQPDERMRIECSLPGLTVNEAPYKNEREGISLAEPIRLRLGPREFAISGIVRRARAVAETDVYETRHFNAEGGEDE